MAFLPVTAGRPHSDSAVGEIATATAYAELVRQANLVGAGVDVFPPWLARAVRAAAEQNWSTAILHPLGFICIPLRRSPGLGVCLHVWSPAVPAARPTTSQVHCHSWDLHSVVLWGELRNHVIRLRRRGRSTHRVFDIHGHGDVDEVRATAELVRGSPGRIGNYRAGNHYAMPAGTFHATVVPGGEAATLVLARDRPGGRDRSLGDLDTSSHQVRRERCRPVDAARLAAALTRLLDPAAGTTRSPRVAGY